MLVSVSVRVTEAFGFVCDALRSVCRVSLSLKGIRKLLGSDQVTDRMSVLDLE